MGCSVVDLKSSNEAHNIQSLYSRYIHKQHRRSTPNGLNSILVDHIPNRLISDAGAGQASLAFSRNNTVSARACSTWRLQGRKPITAYELRLQFSDLTFAERLRCFESSKHPFTLRVSIRPNTYTLYAIRMQGRL